MTKLNLGCGFDHRPKSEGWINIDIDTKKNPDIKWDLDMPLYWILPPEMENKIFFNVKELSFDSVDEVLIKHCLEHLYQTRFFELMKELWHLCKKDALITIIVPHWQAEAAFEPDHKWVYPPRSFRMITDPVYSYLVSPAKFEIAELIEKDDAKEPQTIVKYRVVKDD